MQPSNIQVIGEELAIKWDDGGESFVRLAKLRKACPCAGCKGETDVMGNVYKGKPVWEDGHSTGLFAFDYLRAVADSPGDE